MAHRVGSVAISAVLAACAASGPAVDAGDAREETRWATAEDPFEPLPMRLDLDAKAVALGERLFDDPILSEDGAIACTGCHPLDDAGVDRLPKSRRPGRPEGKWNTPTIFNVAWSYRFNWSARFEELEGQLDGPMQSPDVMATTWPAVVSRLAASPTYVEEFSSVYADGLTETNLRHALATYERSLFTPNSAFDRSLRGDRSALGPEAQEGYAIFKSYGCVSCHQGIAVGGNLLQRLGVMRDFFGTRPIVTDADLGRFRVTAHEEDRYVFRVPSLRNVARTAPYFHDGSAATLPAAVDIMGRYQLGRELTDAEIARLVAFLSTLTGEYRGEPI